MKDANKAYIIVGKFGSTYGVNGWIKIHAYTEFNENILEYRPWYIQRENKWTPITIESGRMQGDRVLVKLAGINSPEEARLMTGVPIAVTRSQLPKLKENEYYWSDLIGLTVINKDGAVLGKVVYLMETGSNDVLVIKGDKEHAIPYLFGTVIKDIDLNKHEIHVDWELL